MSPDDPQSPRMPGSPHGPHAWLLLAAVALALLLAGCAGSALPAPGRYDGPAYAYHVPPGVLFDMRQGRELPPEQRDSALARVRLVFLGEHHTEPRSHAFQLELLRGLVRSGRPVRVALEMFPPEADPALEAWRQGELDESAFLARSGWYTHWGFPWDYYRDIFTFLREHRVPIYGVNASKSTRKAVREDALDGLNPELRDLAGDELPALPPHESYVFDVLTGADHGGGLRPDSPAFRRYYRVQRLWDRAMGIRTARLALEQPGDGVTVLLVGSGHLAHELGANLWARRESDLPALTVWDTLADDSDRAPDGRVRVPLGVADWVRVYLEDPGQKPLPSFLGVKFEVEDGAITVKQVFAGHGSPLKGLRKGDRILAFNGKPVMDEVALRLAYERIGEGKAELEVSREGKTVQVDVTPRPSPHTH